MEEQWAHMKLIEEENCPIVLDRGKHKQSKEKEL